MSTADKAKTTSHTTTSFKTTGSLTSSGASSAAAKKDRDRFGTEELVIILSHFDLGIIQSVKEFPKGSRRAPKLLIKSDRGPFLLKRRAGGKDDPFKVAFTHQLQLHLASRQFPLPHLIGTRADNNSMLQYKDGIYEVFEYISGTGYDAGLESTQDSGRILGLFHKLGLDFESEYQPPYGTYHSAKNVPGAIEMMPKKMAEVHPNWKDHAARVTQITQFFYNSYAEASKNADDIGVKRWPMQIIHADWHPGNTLFQKKQVVAVIDYDACRLAQRVIDVANGAFQFSRLAGGDDPRKWPEYLDESRYKRFLSGYDAVNMLSKSELKAIPWLMLEALITETVIPIAAAGNFARLNGFEYLEMADRKVRWMQDSIDKLASILDA